MTGRVWGLAPRCVLGVCVDASVLGAQSPPGSNPQLSLGF